MQKNQLRKIRYKRERKSIIVFNAEGNNKTEKNYLAKFSSRDVIIRCPSGNATDPKNMYAELKKYCEDNDYGKEYGDKVFLLIDSDLNSNRLSDIKEIEENCNKLGIEIILSTPTFEVWFINHFKYSTHEYKNCDEVLKELKKFIKNYSKNEDIFDKVADKTSAAIQNSKGLEKHHKDLNHEIKSCDCNPYTGVYKVIESIIEISDKNKDNYNK